MSYETVKHQIALTLIPGIGVILAKNLISYCGGPENIFKSPKSVLLKIPGIGEITANYILRFDEWQRVEEEMKFMEENSVEPLFLTDKNYPKRLKECPDSPVLLYFKGNADLNTAKIISIVGTRNATHYGKETCEELIQDLSKQNILIVSGMAYGIDITAHKAALKNNLPTVGVFAHGLDKVYPQIHQSTAIKMMEQGGLLTEFQSCTNPDPENFPQRNRIVAGVADAVVVVETALKGGAMITAEIANSYNRDVFAFPGKVKDVYSQGCNYLIKNNKAALIESAADLIKLMNWDESVIPQRKKQKEIFVELNEDEKKIVNLFQNGESIEIDTILYHTQMTNSQAAATLLNLEFKGVIQSLPGKVYQLI